MNSNCSLDLNNKEKFPYVHDTQLFHRVKQYIETFEDPEGIDIESMVEDLRLKFKDYGRRQKCAFRGAVKRAYRIVMETRDGTNSGTDHTESEVEIDNLEDNDEDGPVEVGLETPAVIAATSYLNSIQKMYTKQNGGFSGAQELINISSDEEEKNSHGNGKGHSSPHGKRRRANVMAQFEKLPNVRVTRVEGSKRPSDASYPEPKRPKLRGPTIATIPSVTFDYFGGFPKVLQEVSELVVHIKESSIYKELGVTPPRGFLLHGPPGCGKTLLAQATAGELKVPLVRVSGPELIAGVSGESESRIRELFESALARAPCILFIDEIDAVSPPRDVARREMERRIVAQLLTCIDGLSEVEAGNKVIIIGATNRPDALDPALRRAGRFDREVCLGIPDRTQRKQILEVLTAGLKLNPDIDLDELASASPGFVGADLKALMSEAAIAAVNRVLKQQKQTLLTELETNGQTAVSSKPSSIHPNEENEPTPSTSMVTDDDYTIEDSSTKTSSTFVKANNYSCLLKFDGSLLTKDQLDSLFIEMTDFFKAFKTVQPSAKREGFATVPDVTWDDIGSLNDVRSELQKSIMMPVKYHKEFEKLGITAPSGILLCGPPGCGKTLLAKAVANEANINFISVKGPELLNMYVGESERAVRQCFQRARNSQPCVIFFDEIDALCPRRSATSEGHNTRVVNQVLTEMDGIEGRKGVFLMAATNRPDMVDLAVLRPGRLDKILYVGLPSGEDRVDILKALTKNGTMPQLEDVDLDKIGKDPLLDGYTGADLAALVKEASVIALTEFIDLKDKTEPRVNSTMLKQAAGNIRPSVSNKDLKRYDEYRKTYGLPQKKPPEADN